MLLLCTSSSSRPTLLLFLFITLDLSEKQHATANVFHFLFSLPASCLRSGGCLCRGVAFEGGGDCYDTTGHSVLAFPSNAARGSVGLGRMLYGVEILRERNDGWESLSEPRAKHFLTSSVGVDER